MNINTPTTTDPLRPLRLAVMDEDDMRRLAVAHARGEQLALWREIDRYWCELLPQLPARIPTKLRGRIGAIIAAGLELSSRNPR